MNFMIIDDSSTMRKIIGLALKSNSYDFIEAENGNDGLVKLENKKIDFFIVDYNMPGMTGIDFVKEIRKKPEYGTTPVVILTTETDDKLVNEGKSAGASAWIVKPFEKDNFLNTIGEVCKRKI